MAAIEWQLINIPGHPVVCLRHRHTLSKPTPRSRLYRPRHWPFSCRSIAIKGMPSVWMCFCRPHFHWSRTTIRILAAIRPYIQGRRPPPLHRWAMAAAVAVAVAWTMTVCIIIPIRHRLHRLLCPCRRRFCQMHRLRWCKLVQFRTMASLSIKDTTVTTVNKRRTMPISATLVWCCSQSATINSLRSIRINC